MKAAVWHGRQDVRIEKVIEPPAEVCEVCGAAPVEKVLHAVPVFFKGSGFYSTDYGRKKRKVESSSDGEGAKTDSGSSKAADKPAEKSTKAADT